MEYNGHKVGIATDLGMVTQLVKEHLKDSSLLYLESNHDPDMLINGPYPWHLKQRIKGRTGHLSNMDAGALVSELKTDALKHVILAHLSEENNCPQKAFQEMSKRLNGSHIALHVAGPDQPGKLINL
jgi:phosphoribosyl 1,2-cyclic phosphodiesterase